MKLSILTKEVFCLNIQRKAKRINQNLGSIYFKKQEMTHIGTLSQTHLFDIKSSIGFGFQVPWINFCRFLKVQVNSIFLKQFQNIESK